MTFNYRREAESMAMTHGIDPDLVEAVCWIESSGQTHAYRYEPQFWRRYMLGKAEWVNALPERVSASYGLMQVMFATAVEHGYPRIQPPEYLFVPIVGLEYGCKVLARRIRKASAMAPDSPEDVRIRAALASYNGGWKDNRPDSLPDRNAAYASKVLDKMAAVKSARA